MISSEVQRTLVKSPPELWAELSDPLALARHLGELGEITITNTEPESEVEWEAGDTRGKVLIEPSGWGTRVKLTVMRELPAPAKPPEPPSPPSPAAEPPAQAAEPPEAAEPPQASSPPASARFAPPEATSPHDTAPAEPASQSGAPPEADEPPDARPTAPPPPEHVEQPLLEGRRGFLARLFSRRRPLARSPEVDEIARAPAAPGTAPSRAASAPEPTPGGASRVEAAPARHAVAAAPGASEALGALSRAIAPSMCAAADPFTLPITPAGLRGVRATAVAAVVEAAQRGATPGRPPDLAAELKAAEEVAVEEVTALLTAVLDRLGAAHHRPFSRS